MVSVVFIALIISVVSSGCLFREELEDEVGVKIVIETVGEFNFDPQDIETVRPDIFKKGISRFLTYWSTWTPKE